MACIYVAFGVGGLVKIGRTANFKRRLSGLNREFKRLGNEVVTAHSFDELSDREAYLAENKLLSKLKGVFNQYYGREWFIGDADEIKKAAMITSHEAFFSVPPIVWPKMSKKRSERLRAENLELRARLEIERIENKAKKKKEIEQRRLLREERKRDIIRREAVRLGLIPADSAMEASR